MSDQDANLFALEQRSYANRPNKGGNDWSYDAVDAARLEQPSQVESNLVSLTETHQVYPNGFADIGSTVGSQPYQEQSANVATAVDEALAQDYDGIIRFAPAWPSDWNGSGTVYIQRGDKVDVQVENGQLVTAAIQAATSGLLTVKNPWPGQQVEVVSGTARTRSSPGHRPPTCSPSRPARAAATWSSRCRRRPRSCRSPRSPAPRRPPTRTSATSRSASTRPARPPPRWSAPCWAPPTPVTASPRSTTPAPDEAAQTTASDVDGLQRPHHDPAGGSATENDMYFSIDPSVAATSSYDATITVSYYDSGTGTVALQYDNGSGDPYHTAGTITLTGSDTWKTASFTVTGAYFGGLEAVSPGTTTGGADFRLDAAAADHRAQRRPVGHRPGGSGHDGVPARAGDHHAEGRSDPHARLLDLRHVRTGRVGDRERGLDRTVHRHRHRLRFLVVRARRRSPQRQADHHRDRDRPDRVRQRPVGGGQLRRLGPAAGHRGRRLDRGADQLRLRHEREQRGLRRADDRLRLAGLSALTSTDSNIYFSVDDSVAYEGDYSATFTVEYYDSGTGSFQVQYDNGTSDPYQAATPNIPLTNTDTWKTATVTGAGAYFGNLQNGGADFRLRNGSGQLTVHSVAVKISGDGVANVTDFPPPVAAASP